MAELRAFEFTCDHLPTARRPRFTNKGICYKDARNKHDEMAVKNAYNLKYSGFPTLDSELEVIIDIYEKLPESKKRIKQEPATYKPDADNVAKLILDALNAVAWKDDRQVTKLTVDKHPRCIIAANRIVVQIIERGE